jgi:hypothetical protein
MIHASAPGFVATDVVVSVAEGKVETVNLELKRDASAPADRSEATPAAGPRGGTSSPAASATTPWRTVGFVTVGVGAAGLVLGAITGGLAVSQHSTLAGECPSGCLPKYASDLNSYHTFATISSAGFIGGGALAALGAVLWVTAPSGGRERSSVQATVGLNYVGARVEF